MDTAKTSYSFYAEYLVWRQTYYRALSRNLRIPRALVSIESTPNVVCGLIKYWVSSCGSKFLRGTILPWKTNDIGVQYRQKHVGYFSADTNFFVASGDLYWSLACSYHERPILQTISGGIGIPNHNAKQTKVDFKCPRNWSFLPTSLPRLTLLSVY